MALSRRDFIRTMAASAFAVAATGVSMDSLAQDRKVVCKPANVANDHKTAVPVSDRPVISVAGEYSECRPVVAIAILKGTKDELPNSKTGKPFTAEEIGEFFAKRLGKEVVPVPIENTKVFVQQTDGDYARVAFFVKNRLFGKIYSGAEAKNATAGVSDVYNLEWRVRPQVEKERVAQATVSPN